MARIGYVLTAFPVVSETFILNELRAVEAAGLPIAVFSLSQAPAGPRHIAKAFGIPIVTICRSP